MSNVARVFISYRSSDGVDKATALARDLDAAFGADQVFLDKDDLPAGLPWRDAVAQTLGARPVLLMLVTPDTFGARDATGARRIDDASDPVRREVVAALDAGAHVLPLLADGVERLPEGDSMPAALAPLAERTWRRLRAYDWRDDIERLVADIEALGVARPGAANAERRHPGRRRELAITAAAGVVAGASLAGALWAGSALVSARDAAAPFAGVWRANVAPPANESGSRFEGLVLHVAQQGEQVTVASEPIDIRADPAWRAFAAQWRERFGTTLDAVVMRGEGRSRRDPGTPPALDIALRLEPPRSDAPIETGNLRAQLLDDRRRAEGRLWMNGEQAERAVQLARQR